MATNKHECSICIESFKNPKLLPCYHTFCATCLDSVITTSAVKGHFECPVCTRKVEIPKGGVSGFETNFYITTDDKTPNQLGLFTCDICGPKATAVGRCLDCGENFCQFCCSYHEKMKATKTHKIQDLSDPDMKGKVRQRSFCIEHEDEEIKVVCLQCNIPICIVCKAINHEGHAAKTVANATSDAKKQLEAKLALCNAKLERLRALHQEGESDMKEIDRMEEDDIKAVEEKCMFLISLIKEDEKNMRTKIKSTYDKCRTENSNRMLALKKDSEACTSTAVDVQKVIEQLSDTEMIKKNQELEQKVLNILGAKETKLLRGNFPGKLFAPDTEKRTTLAHMIGSIKDPTQKSGNVDNSPKAYVESGRSTSVDYKEENFNNESSISSKERSYYPEEMKESSISSKERSYYPEEMKESSISSKERSYYPEEMKTKSKKAVGETLVSKK